MLARRKGAYPTSNIAGKSVSANSLRPSALFRETGKIEAGQQEPSMDPEPQDDHSTIEDRFAEQDVPRYSTRSSALVIVGMVVVLGILYLFLR
jgi:hypothetical protein